MDNAEMERPKPQDLPPRASSRRLLWVLLALLIAAGAWALWSRGFGGAGGLSASAASDFNILLITLDTTRADYIGCYGNETVQTPVTDRLAAEGVMFRNCTTCTSLTAPSHASIMTAVYPFVHGVRNNGARRLPAGCTTLAERLKEAGYSTGAEIASAVLDHSYAFDQGFDTYADVPSDPHESGYAERRGDDVCDAAIEQLRSMAGSKFFLWVHFYDPHHPYEAPGFTGGSREEAYGAEIAFMDAQVGRLIEELDKLGLGRRTLVVVVGDHGEGLTEHNETGHGYFVYDTTLRAPFIIRCPGTVPAGRLIDARVRTIDIYPTLLEAIGIDPPADAQGTSLIPLLSGEADDLALAAYGESLFGHVRYGMSPLRCLTVGEWKYVLAPSPALYNIEADPEERHNVIDEHPDLARHIREQLHALIAEAPPPPAKDEVAVTLTPADRARLESLGYAGGSVPDEEVNEMDIFEPSGDDPREHVQLIHRSAEAVEAMARGDYATAASALRFITSEFPEAAAPLADLARAVGKQGMADEASDLFQRALTLAPHDDYIRRMFVEALIAAQRWTEAIEQLTKMIDTVPDDVGVPYHLGVALVGLERFDEAIEEFERGMRIDPEDVRPTRGIVLALSRQGRLEEAEALARDALERFLDSASLRADLAGAMHEQGRNDEAVEMYRRALELDPDDAWIRKSLGALLVTLERWDEAMDQYTRVVERSPHDLEALYQKAAAAAKVNRNDEALADYKRARQIAPDDLRVLRGMALVLTHMRRFAEAENVLQDAAMAHPDSGLVLGDLAYAKQMQGAADEAYDLYQDALLLAPDETSVRAMLGGLLVQLSRWDEALTEFNKVIEASPDDLAAHYNLGQILGRLERLDEARQHFERAMEIDPTDVRMPHGLGVLYARQKQFAEAAAYFRKALAIDPNYRPAQRDLQRVLQMMGQP